MIVDNDTRLLLEQNGIIVDNFKDVDTLLEKINDRSYSTRLSDPLVQAYLKILKDNKQEQHNLRKILKYHQIYELDNDVDDRNYSTKEIESFIKSYTSIMWEEDVYDYNRAFVKALYASSVDISKELINAHKYTYNNKKYLIEDNRGICYSCMEDVRVEDIIDYIDNGKTAICPYCNAPTIIPIRIKQATNRVFLEEMLKRWYQDNRGEFIDGVAAYDNFYLPSANFSFDRTNIIKGYNDYYKNKVSSLNVSINKSLTRVISSINDGKEIYQVDIRLKNDVVKFMSCSCPLNGNCHHEYTAIMAYLRDYYSYKTEISELKEIINWLKDKDVVVTFANDDYMLGNTTSKLKELFQFITASTISIYSRSSLIENINNKRIDDFDLEECITYLTVMLTEYKDNKSIVKKHIDDGSLLTVLEKIYMYLTDKEKSAESREVL